MSWFKSKDQVADEFGPRLDAVAAQIQPPCDYAGRLGTAAASAVQLLQAAQAKGDAATVSEIQGLLARIEGAAVKADKITEKRESIASEVRKIRDKAMA